MPDYGDAKLQLYYDQQWNDAPLADPKRGTVSIVRGRGPQQEQPSPSALSAVVDNFSGDYNPRNPMSDLYGKIGRNTPTRLYLGSPNLLGDDNSSTANATAQVAPALDAPTSGIMISVWASPNESNTYTLPTGMSPGTSLAANFLRVAAGRQTVSSGTTGTRTATCSASDVYVAGSVFVAGPSSVTTGSIFSADASFTLDVVDSGDVWVVVSVFRTLTSGDPVPVPAFPSDTDGGGWIVLADTGDVHWLDGNAEWGRLKAWAKRCRTVNDSHVISLPGVVEGTMVSYATRVPAGEVSGDWDIRGCGEAASWQPNRTGNFEPDTKGDAWTGLSANGVLRRLGRGSPAVRSALFRHISNTLNPAGYWPMEDSTDATLFSSGLPGGSPMTVVQQGGVDLAIDDTLPGSAPLPQTTRNLDVETQMIAAGPLSGVTNTTTVGFWTSIPDRGSASTDFGQSMQVAVFFSGGSVPVLTVGGFYDPSTGLDSWFADNGNGTLGIGSTTATHSQQWRFVRAVFEQDGSDLRTRLWVDETSIDDVTDTSETLGTPVLVEVFVDAGSDATQRRPEYLPASIGHVSVWDGVVTPADMRDAGAGWPDELIVDRFLRVCAEERVPAAVLGDDTHTMGPQAPDTLSNLLTELELTGGGILYEPRDQLGLVYRTVGSLYNQDARLELDWDSGKMAPLTPVVDDQYTRNDVGVSRRSGSAHARAVQDVGPLNVNDPADDPDGVGRYTSQITANPGNDSDLPNLAGWYLHLGTVDETRFPQVTVDLDLYDTVADDAAAVDIGDRITIDNAPVDLSPDLIDLLVVGYTEHISPTRRTIDFNCVPESAYQVAVYDTDRYESKRTYRQESAGAINTTQTSITLVSVGVRWVTDSSQFPFNAEMNGEVWKVTSISSATQTGNEYVQLWTVERSQNGVVKSHPAGSNVRLFKQARYAL